jgi:transposase
MKKAIAEINNRLSTLELLYKTNNKAIAEINNRLSTLELLYKTNNKAIAEINNDVETNKAIAEINNDVETNKAIAEINDETIFSKTTTFEGISYDELKNFLIDNYYKSNRDIAKHFGVTAEHIYYLINKYELGYLKRYNYKRNLSYNQTKIEKSILKELFNNDQHVVSSSINIDKDKTTISKRKISYDELKNYIENNPNQSLEKIGMHFGRGRSYIQTLVAKYRIKYETKNKIKIDIERLREYVTNNPKKNNEEIAAYFGMSKNRIAILIREFGISHGLDRYTRLVEAQQLREHIKNNPRDSLFDIGTAFGVSSATISKCIKKYNIEYKRKNKH